MGVEGKDRAKVLEAGAAVISSQLGVAVQRLRAALDRHRASRIPVAPAMIVEQRTACPAGEPREGDMLAAHYLLEHPNAYAAALLGPDGTPILR